MFGSSIVFIVGGSLLSLGWLILFAFTLPDYHKYAAVSSGNKDVGGSDVSNIGNL